MKKLLYITLFTLSVCIICLACDDQKSDPGYAPASMSIFSVTDSVNTELTKSGKMPYAYNYTTKGPRDTIYIRTRVIRDTTWKTDSNGQFVLDEKGNKIVGTIKERTEEYPGRLTGKLYEVGPIIVPNYKNKLYIQIQCNYRWYAPAVSFATETATWIKNSKQAGIRDAIIEYDIKPRSANNTPGLSARKEVMQYIFSRDSTIMYKIKFSQQGT